jgi:hypothetical protein
VTEIISLVTLILGLLVAVLKEREAPDKGKVASRC